MNFKISVSAFILGFATPFTLTAGTSGNVTVSVFECEDGLNCSRVTGFSRGNHELDCTVIRPWSGTAEDGSGPHPVIAWANGWDQGNVVGQHTTNGYLPGLKKWALDGPYIVVAANQWSVQDSDILACLQWVVDNEPSADANWTGLAGHSQGGGAVIHAGDGLPNGPEITASVAMTPYGPSWVDAGDQDGPVIILGGTDDTTTPVSSFIDAWEQINQNKGGVLAVLDGGTHNSDAWGVDENGNTLDSDGAAEHDFGNFQEVTEHWWQKHLNGNDRSGRTLKRILDKTPWDTDYGFSAYFDL